MNKQSIITINATLRKCSVYTWASIGVLFALYLYFVGAITFSIITQKQLTQQNKVLVSAMSKQELQYLANDKKLTREYAVSQGFVHPDTIAFVPQARAFAFNGGR